MEFPNLAREPKLQILGGENKNIDSEQDAPGS